MLNFSCQRCGECCKKYFIVSLPHEVEKQAKLLGMQRKEFIVEKMQLFLQVFPSGFREEKLLVSSSFLPKKIAEKIGEKALCLPDLLVVVPALVFRRDEEGYCVNYGRQNSACTVYSERPCECRLFPFISEKKTGDYSKLYPFCHGLKERDSEKSYVDLSFIHFGQVNKYLETVRKEGFSSVWKQWPSQGVLLYEDNLVGQITEEEFFGALGPYG